MKESLTYKGMTNVPPDIDCEDGELTASVNIINEDGAMRPIVPPKVVIKAQEIDQYTQGAKCVLIHKPNSHVTNYLFFLKITESNVEHGYLWYMNETDGVLNTDRIDIADEPSAAGFSAMGNTVIFNTSKGLFYVLWDNGAYRALGTMPPQMAECIFSLDGEFKISEGDLRDFKNHDKGLNVPDSAIKEEIVHVSRLQDFNKFNTLTNNTLDLDKTFATESDSDAAELATNLITNIILAQVNKFIGEARDDNKFTMPFFVRFAWRLYDGSHICHSAPIWLFPSDGAPRAWINTMVQHPGTSFLTFRDNESGDADPKNPLGKRYVASQVCTLMHQIRVSAEIAKWKGIITALDIFVSPPFYRYDQSGKVYGWKLIKLCEERSVTSSTSGLTVYYGDKSNDVGFTVGHCELKLPNIAVDKYTAAFSKRKYSRRSWAQQYLMANKDFPLLSSGMPWGEDYQNPSNCKFTGWNYSWDSESEYENQIKGTTKNCRVPSFFFTLPLKSDIDYRKEIESASNCYLAKSYSLKEILNWKTNEAKTYYILNATGNEGTYYDEGGVELDMPENFLNSIEARERLDDDYKTNNAISAEFSTVYNSRLFLGNVTETLFNGYIATSMFAKSHRSVWGDPEGHKSYYRAWTFLNKDGKTKVVETSSTDMLYMVMSDSIDYVFYPDPDAYRMVIYKGADAKAYYDFTLKRSDYLNGAYWISDLKFNRTLPELYNPTVVTNAALDNVVEYPNKVYGSAVNNPFFFSASGRTAVGTGTILGITSAAKAMSQGQFGEFPLYGFSTDGVWSLKFDATGTITAAQPITMDVCTCPESITQLDNQVAFATSRGIMILSGSECKCISDSLNSRDRVSVSALPRWNKVAHLFGAISSSAGLETAVRNMQFDRFINYISDCKMKYDYLNQRLYVYRNAEHGYDFCYVFSLRTALWAIVPHTFYGNINSYPDAYVMSGDGVVNLSNTDSDIQVPILMVTMPFKLKTLLYKTIDVAVQRGYFNGLKQILYGSNDLRYWFVVSSSDNEFLRGFHGSPYNYFRFAIMGNMSADDTIYTATCDFRTKLDNQQR